MKIVIDGQYKHVLFKEFTDDSGQPKPVGQIILSKLLNLSHADFLSKLRELVADHTFRYAYIDLLYWYEFQNTCQEILST